MRWWACSLTLKAVPHTNIIDWLVPGGCRTAAGSITSKLNLFYFLARIPRN